MVQSEHSTIHRVLNHFSRNTLIPIITELMMHFGATKWRRRGGCGMSNQKVGEYNVLTYRFQGNLSLQLHFDCSFESSTLCLSEF